jgi:hypothetical protein
MKKEKKSLKHILPLLHSVHYVEVLISLWLLIFVAQPKEFFLDGLEKLEQRSRKCVELRGNIQNKYIFFKPVACCFLYKAKDLSAPVY